MIRLVLVMIVAFAAACSPAYPFQKCTENAECGGGQQCVRGCPTSDGGVAPSGYCLLPCTVDADCNNLGLKKPFCAGDMCGRHHCYEAPF